MPEISVILPFFNAEKTLERSVNSIINQTFGNFELIAVNNNSSDNSEFIIKNIAEKNSRIKIFNESKQGVVFASIKGLQNSRAKLIARADADDVWHPNKLNLQYTFLKNRKEIDVVSCRIRYIGNLKNKGMIAYVKETNNYLTHNDITINRFSELQVINPTILFRKQIAEQFGFYKNGDFPEDYEMFLRWAENGVKFHKLSDILLDWYDSEKRLTRTDDRYSFDAFYKIKSDYLFRYLKKNNPFFPEIVVWGAGKLSRKRLNYLQNLGIKVKFFIDVDKNKIDNKNIISYKNIPEPRNFFIVSFVNNQGMREKIKDFLIEKKYIEGVDFIIA